MGRRDKCSHCHEKRRRTNNNYRWTTALTTAAAEATTTTTWRGGGSGYHSYDYSLSNEIQWKNSRNEKKIFCEIVLCYQMLKFFVLPFSTQKYMYVTHFLHSSILYYWDKSYEWWIFSGLGFYNWWKGCKEYTQCSVRPKIGQFQMEIVTVIIISHLI